MSPSRSMPWAALLGAMVGGVLLTGVALWQWNLQAMQARIHEKHAVLKKLLLSGKIPPNQNVMDYLSARQMALESKYRRWLAAITTPPLTAVVSADPQVHFQEQFHETQRTLERLATARNMKVPELLGFPKELPPTDTVPRLLAQLLLIQEVTKLMLEQGTDALVSCRVDDPETVLEQDEAEPFLRRVPIRVRLTSTLPALMNILGAIERVRPAIDVRALRIASAPPSNHLEVELVLARYLVVAAEPQRAATEALQAPSRDRAIAPGASAVLVSHGLEKPVRSTP